MQSNWSSHTDESTNLQDLTSFLSECLNEVWKGDMGMKESVQESDVKGGRPTHDSGEL